MLSRIRKYNPFERGRGRTELAAMAQVWRDRFPSLAPMHVCALPHSSRRVTLITDSINAGSLFGGVATSMIFCALLAKRLDARLRIVTVTERPNTSNFVVIMKFHEIAWNDDVEFVFSPLQEDGDQVDVGPTDIFVTTSWWTTHSAKLSIPRNRIVHLIQEDERMFYPYGDEHLLCSESMSDENIHFVVNSRLLFDHFKREGFHSITRDQIWFEPAFPRKHYFLDEGRKGGKLQFLFYARPNNARNLFYRGIEAIEAAIQREILTPAEWDFTFVGKDLKEFSFARGVTPRLLQLDWLAYVALARATDLGLSLMYTPHPSYPPLDLAACGSVAVTNRFPGKSSLSLYSPNILCAEPSLEAIVNALAEGAALARDPLKRRENYECTSVNRDWPEAMETAISKVAGLFSDVS